MKFVTGFESRSFLAYLTVFRSRYTETNRYIEIGSKWKLWKLDVTLGPFIVIRLLQRTKLRRYCTFHMKMGEDKTAETWCYAWRILDSA
jgi:hypothetical protein